jgi:hypothetical protein
MKEETGAKNNVAQDIPVPKFIDLKYSGLLVS